MTLAPAADDRREAVAQGARHTRKHLDYLDGWRGIAILLVLLGHFFHIRGVTAARLGVEFFFVLSGRLMAHILFVERFPLPEFYKRRVSRILPALLLFCLTMVLLPPLHPQLAVQWIDALQALTFTLNYFRAAAGDAQTTLDHVWSLCVEEHGYMLLALFAVWHRRSSMRPEHWLGLLAIACMANGVIQTLVLERNYYQVYWRTDVRLAPILVAASCYLALRDRPIRLPLLPEPLVPVAALALGLSFHLNVWSNPVKYTLGSLFLALAVATLDRAPAFVLRPLSHPALVRIGIWSYSLYLWQQPFHMVRADYPALLMLPLVFGLALASFYLVERPVRTYLNRRW